MTSEIEESPGVTSSMRMTVKFARPLGAWMIASGIALAALSLILGRGYELITVEALLISTGAAMITGLGFAKAMQSKYEGRDS